VHRCIVAATIRSLAAAGRAKPALSRVKRLKVILFIFVLLGSNAMEYNGLNKEDQRFVPSV
jgi:hypothetical protein